MTERLPRAGLASLVPWLLVAALVEVAALAGVDQWLWPYPTALLDSFEDHLAEVSRPEPVQLTWLEVEPRLEPSPDEPPTFEKKRKKRQENKPEPLAMVPRPPPRPVPPPPAEQQEPKPKPPEESVPRNKKSVLVDDDDSVVEEVPLEAQYLSDKNRRVAEQTRATETNLEKFSKGEAEASDRSEDTKSEDIGGKEERIAQQQEAEASSPDARRTELASIEGGKHDSARGLIEGEEGKAGEEGDGATEAGPLSMRNPGKLAAGGAGGETAETTGKVGKQGKKGRRGPKLALDFDDYRRVAGDEQYREEKEVARRQRSHKKGRWSRKMAAIHSSLENFVPEVKPGNQTALNTRAAPFAAFIARMHLRIHELWGFGFLVDLADVPASHPMNDWQLATKLEIIIAPDGKVEKVTIARPSGYSPFDIAAVDTVLSAGPYGDTPSEIRSGNGKVYLHWTFHRDHRQCATYFAEPYILDNAPEGADAGDAPDDIVSFGPQRRPERLEREKGSATDGDVHVGHRDADAGQGLDAFVLRAASAFEARDIAALTAASAVPFQVNETRLEGASFVEGVWSGLLGEVGSRIQRRRLLSPAGYRAAYGHLPKGVAVDDRAMFLVMRTTGATFALWLGVGSDGWEIRGLSR